MSTNTYVALQTYTIPSATNSYTFTNIPQGYADLVLISNFTLSSNGSITFQAGNGSVNTNNVYSSTILNGNGSAAQSSRNGAGNFGFITGQFAAVTAGNNAIAETHFQNYSNTTTYKTSLSRGSVPAQFTDASVNLFASTVAIDTIKIYVLGGSVTIAAGSTFTLYGIANADVGAYATGGIITQDANYYYHAFGSSSTFTPTRNLTADILVVAGGGGGGKSYGGGGGAGGLLAFASQSLTSGTGYSCTIGAGGAGATSTSAGSLGVDSQFASLTLVKGGGGGGTNGVSTPTVGGSGGGGSYGQSGASATSGQGYAGGTGYGSSHFGAGGGGGSGAIGGAGTSTYAGDGGAGTSNYSSWLATTGLGVNSSGTYYIAAGGGGGTEAGATGGNGGIGGGGAGTNSSTAGSNALVNTGSGGGGGGYAGSQGNGGNGGSGLIIVRYSK